MKRKLALFLCAALALTGLTGCGPKVPPDASAPDTPSASGSSSSANTGSGSSDSCRLPRIMVLSGPTGVGAAKLMADHENISAEAVASGKATPVIDTVTVEVDNQAVTNALINGDADIAAIATNVAANLYAKSDGAIQVLAVNTLGVLYILEKGDSIHTMADLQGKTVYATGQGANPEYVLDHLLTENGVDPAAVDIQWMTAQEVSAKMASSEQAICMLPVPAATALMVQDSGVRQALSLSDEWGKLDQGPLPMGCIAARTDYIEANPEGVAAFLQSYQASIQYMSDPENLEQAAQLAARFQLTPNEKVAAAAIPQCNLTFLAGKEMRSTLENYYAVLFRADPASIGGGMPYDSFYYEAG